MRRVLSLISILLLAAACSRDTAETRNPGGDAARPMAEGAPATQTDTTATTATSPTATDPPPAVTTDTTATRNQQP